MAEVIHRYIGGRTPVPPKPEISPEEKNAQADRRKLGNELTAERSREVRTRRMQSQLLLAKARGELIPKAMVEQQAGYIFLALRQKIMQVPHTHARRILNLSDYGKAREVLKAIMTGLLSELQDLPQKMTDPNFLKELEKDGG